MTRRTPARISAIGRPARISAIGIVLLSANPAGASSAGLEIFPDGRVFVLVALFLLLIFPAQKLLIGPLLRVLEERSERIEGARRRAEVVADAAKEVLDRYEAAIHGARESAEQSRRSELDQARRGQTQVTMAARGDAERELERVRQEVASALADARAQLRREAEGLAREAAAQVLGRPLS